MSSGKTSLPASIELHGVGHVYEGKGRRTVALESVDLSVGRGEFVLVSGPSGSGKTTLLLTAAGLLTPSEGHVFWGRRDIGAMADRDVSALRAEGIGVTLQAADLVSTLTALENVALPALTGGANDAWERARSSLMALRISHLAQGLPRELSGGERRRVAVARALVAGSAFVVADEPTADLDPVSANVVMDALSEAARRGAGVLVMSHDPSFGHRASRSCLLVSGRLKEGQ